MNDPQYFEIQAEDPAKAAAFYTAVFGWKAEKDPMIPIEYWRLETEGARGAILKRPVAAPPMSGTNAFVCSMQVKSFDRTAEAIMKNGGQVAMAKFAIPGKCWQGYFLDTDKNTFGIFEADPEAK